MATGRKNQDDATRGRKNDVTTDERNQLQLRWFLLGFLFLLVAIGFAGWAFHLKCLSQEQQRILQWALPIASAFMAWTFAGGISAGGRSLIAGLTIFATGGFAIWLLTTYFLLPKVMADPQCGVLACSEARPCVDIFRLADFRKNHCLADGKKFDVVLLDDTYTLDPPQQRYIARANRNVIKAEKLRVFDLMTSNKIPIPVVDGGVAGPEQEQLMFSAKVDGGEARIRYEWHDTFPGEATEGLGFLSNYTIRNIRVKILLPPDVSIPQETLKFVVPTKARQLCDHSNMQCENLYVDTEVELHWVWNMWEDCPSASSRASG